MQRVPVAGPVAQHQGSRARLPPAVTALQERRERVRIADRLAEPLGPAIGGLGERRVGRGAPPPGPGPPPGGGGRVRRLSLRACQPLGEVSVCAGRGLTRKRTPAPADPMSRLASVVMRKHHAPGYRFISCGQRAGRVAHASMNFRRRTRNSTVLPWTRAETSTAKKTTLKK